MLDTECPTLTSKVQERTAPTKLFF